MNFESSLDFCFLSGIKLVSYYNAADKKGLDLHGQSFSFKWNMHHKYDVNSKDTSLAAKGAPANRLQRRTACKIQNGRQGAPIWQSGSENVSTPRFLGVPVNFC